MVARSPGPGTARATGLAVLSMLLPGAGQLLARRWRRGLLLLSATALVAAGAVGLAARGPVSLTAWLLRPGALLWLLAVNAGLLLLRLYATLDAFRPLDRLRSSSGWRTMAVALVASVLVALTAGPHLLAAEYTWSTRALLLAVFDDAGRPPPTQQPPVPSTGTGDTPGRDRPSPSETAPAGPGPAGVPLDGTLRDAVREHEVRSRWIGEDGNPWLERDHVTIALLGSDAGPGRGGDRTDAMLVASIDVETGAAVVLSVDRYMEGFPLPNGLDGLWREHCTTGFGWTYLNALYRCGTDRIPSAVARLYPDSPDPAAAVVQGALSELLGIRVDHYVLVDMGGFVPLIDALGGVEVDVARRVRAELSPPYEGAGWRTYDIAPGLQRLDGAHALAFVRDRKTTSDLDRMRRQRCLLTAIADRADPLTLLRRFPAVAAVLEEHVRTSIPLEAVPGLVELAERVDRDAVVTVGITRPRFGRGGRADLDRIHATVHTAIEDPGALVEEPTVERGDEVCT